MEIGAFIGGVLVAGFIYFLYTKVKESRERKSSGSGSGGGGGGRDGGRDVHIK